MKPQSIGSTKLAKRPITSCPSCGAVITCDKEVCTVHVAVRESVDARRTAIEVSGRVVHFCAQCRALN